MGDDILFLVLVALIFFIGISFYKFEGFQSTPQGQLYQTQSINTDTALLNDGTANVLENISSMVNGITNDIQSKINSTKEYIEGCVGCFKYCGKEPYVCRGCCDGAPYPCDWGCVKRAFGKCVAKGYRNTCRNKVDFWRTRDKCTDPIPKWNCSPNPPGFSMPSAPNSWSNITKKSC